MKVEVDDPTGAANDPTGSRGAAGAGAAGAETQAVFDRRGLLVHGWDLFRLSIALPLVAPLVAACGGSEQGGEAPAAGSQPGGSASGAKSVEPMTSESEAEGAMAPESAGSGEETTAPAQTSNDSSAEANDAADSTKLVNEIDANAALVSSLNFHVESPKPDQRCEICHFYTATGGGRGKCQLFPRGRVPAGGWCASWQPITPPPSTS